ncbi:MAG: sugar phosphate isomerase/epimerase [Clostridia bacterium]|nr:sugar phosphate isomerase/epimerase [Clostridia bacterium]
MKLGVLIQLQENIEEEFKKVAQLGFSSCQLCSWDESLRTNEMAEKVKDACKKYGVEISTFWCGWSGPMEWNFYEGPHTLGLVPEEYREKRMKQLKQGSDFAKKIGVVNLATHAGFLPEVPDTAEYKALIECLREVALHIRENGQYFLFETGQETPVTLRRVIEDIGTGNLGINLDPANLILYGKANPVDALYVFGDLVRDVHAKDGCCPTDGKNLGVETPLGEGMVNFPALIKKLKEVGYDGALTIEREISGEEQIKDIKMAKAFLESIVAL